MRIGGAALGILILAGCALLLPEEITGSQRLLLVLCLLPLAQIGDLFEWELIASGNASTVAKATLIVFPLSAILRIYMAISGADVAAFAWILVGEWAIRSAILRIARRRPPEQRELSATTTVSAVELLGEALPLLLAGIAVFLYMRLDQFMIGAILDAHSVGLYSAVVTISEMPLVIPAILLKTTLPLLTSLESRDSDAFNGLFEKLIRNLFYTHLAGALVLFLVAEQLILLLYGEAFLGSVSAFRIMVLASPLIAIGVMSSAWLVVKRRTGHALRRTMIGLGINVLLNLILIPAMGLAGAAISTLAAQLFATLLGDVFFRDTRELFWLKLRSLVPYMSHRK